MSDGNEFAELLWENGQAVVHGRRKHPQPSFQPFGTGSSGIQEKHPGGAGDNMMAFTKAAGVFGGMGMAPSLHDFAPGLQHENGDDDAVPWIHYPIMEDDDDDDNNNNNAPALTTADYSSDFFSELQEAAANLGSLPLSNQCTTNNRGTPVAGSSRAASKEIQGLPALTTRTAEPQAELAAAAAKQARPSDSVMNFSLFSRPAALARATLQSAHRPQGTDKVPNAGANNRMESTVIQAASGPRTGPVFADQRAAWPQQKEVRFAPAPAQTASVGNLQQEMARDKLSNNRVVQHKDAARKAPDATVTTSSVCSGNGVVNDEPWHQQKRKIQAECSASQDEDLDDESGALLTSTNRSMKRSRTAEVHNLSERRRRDKINEKMRALQELIPNCNKIDKASMLDEAIEYLKTLQLQVQMMSMGTGLCIPPMLLPPAMQHLQLSQMAHFPRLSMGLGYGMGVFDMNNTGTIPVSPMPGAHFPYQMIPGAAAQGLGIPGANAMQMFGIPGQAIPSSGSSVPPFTSLAGLLVRQNLAPEVSGAMPSMVQEQQQGTANQQQQSLNKEAKQ